MTIELTVNGNPHTVDVEPDETLLHVLRERLRLTGTKEGCGEGECGSCTVLVDSRPVTSCLVLAASVQGSMVETIEGLQDVDQGEPHPIIRALVEGGGVQCGFCTPGMVMSIKALLDQTPNPSREDIQQAISGNLCRCTGYAKIVSAVERLIAERCA